MRKGHNLSYATLSSVSVGGGEGRPAEPSTTHRGKVSSSAETASPAPPGRTPSHLLSAASLGATIRREALERGEIRQWPKGWRTGWYITLVCVVALLVWNRFR
jgi:hypothetical protein